MSRHAGCFGLAVHGEALRLFRPSRELTIHVIPHCSSHGGCIYVCSLIFCSIQLVFCVLRCERISAALLAPLGRLFRPCRRATPSSVPPSFIAMPALPAAAGRRWCAGTGSSAARGGCSSRTSIACIALIGFVVSRLSIAIHIQALNRACFLEFFSFAKKSTLRNRTFSIIVSYVLDLSSLR